MSSLQGKVIAITGAASGIGLATAHLAASHGAHLALADINTSALSTLSTALLTTYPSLNLTITTLNVTSSASVDAWIAATMTHFGRLDGAANIDGVETRPGTSSNVPIADITDEHWRFLLDVNLTGVFYCVRAQIRVMGKGGNGGVGGSIVNAASTAGLQGAPGLSAYCASKHGVVGLTKCAAKEGGEMGVRVNAVCPGAIDTALYRRIVDEAPQFTAALEAKTPMKRVGKAEEIARIFCFLLSDEASWVNGTTVRCDGGAG